ncbi:CBS domain-containing protein CBSX5-like [Durio zibethinus]|uniref:CBS domain-containing protein CBSX5-like n=1 Tax=Durio zibethinus TaxID=66656 RepID=A0A6P5XK26_DURZI|nr:CBS domain-containing protein CBSX5-like [Durio zibethinus]XP_022777360.1 CBS domain-containing protein CBSX5-like [Durio zibethinus]
MAVSLLAREVSDLCLGKPALRSLSISSTVADALSALKRFADNYISVWNCDHRHSSEADKIDAGFDECRCVGKVCMVDIICFLCKEENLSNPGTALQASVSILIPKAPGFVRHLEPNASLVEAIDLILEGAQNLVIPLEIGTMNSRKKLLQKSPSNSTLHNNQQYCWLTQEDIIRYLLNSIGLFCPTPINPINSLNIIDARNIMAVHYDDPASLALPFIAQSLEMQTSVAIVDADGKLIGEISPFTLNSCDEDVAAAIATLSAGDLMAYIDCGGAPEDLIQLVKERLQARNLAQALELMEEDSRISSGASFSSSYSSSSDEEFGVWRSIGRSGGYSARVVRRSEAIVCYPWSSLVAVMIQALAHRVSYVWVVQEDGTLAGIVTFAGMMKVFRERFEDYTLG